MKLNKYYDYDNIEYKGIRDVENLFNQSTDEDYYKPIKTKSAFNGDEGVKEDIKKRQRSKGNKDKHLSPEEYFDMIRPYLSELIYDHKTLKNLRVHSSNETQFGEWKIQLTMSINFISSKDSDKIRNMHTKSNNTEIIIGSETNDIIEELRESLLQNYHNNLEESIKESEFVRDRVDLLYYQLQKTSLKRTGSSYIDSPKWLKNKKATVNPKITIIIAFSML